MAIEVATAYVSLTPSTRGFSDAVKAELTGSEMTTAVSSAGEKAGGLLSSGMGKALAVGGLAVGAAAGGLIFEGVKTAMDRASQNDKLVASLGLTPGQATEAGQVAGQVFASGFGTSFSDVNSAIAAVQSNLADLGDTGTADFSHITKEAISAAQVIGVDVAGATRAAAQLMRTGLVKDGEQGLNDLTAAAQQLPTALRGELPTAVDRFGATFKQLGFTGEQALGALTSGAQHGAKNLTTAGMVFQGFVKNATSGSKAAVAGLTGLGLKSKDIMGAIAKGGPDAEKATSKVIEALGGLKDPLKQQQIGTALFGASFKKVGLDAVLAMDPAIASLGDVGNAADKAGEEMHKSLGERIDILKRQGLVALSDVAERFVVPALEKVVDWGGKAVAWVKTLSVPELFSWLKDHKEIVIGALTAFGVIVASVLVPAFIGWAAGAASAAIATIVALAPILAIGAAIGLLAAGVIYAYTHWGWFHTAVLGVGRFMRDELLPAGMAVYHWIIDSLVPALVSAGEWILHNVVPAIGSFIGWLVKLAVSGYDLSVKLAGYFMDIVHFIEGLPGQIASAASSMWDGITKPFRDAMDAIRRLWNDTVGGFSISIPSWLPVPGAGSSFTIPKLHTGGIVPGPAGSEHLYVLQAGETVIPAPDSPAAAGSQGAAGQGGIHIDQVHVHNRPLLEQLVELQHLMPAA